MPLLVESSLRPVRWYGAIVFVFAFPAISVVQGHVALGRTLCLAIATVAAMLGLWCCFEATDHELAFTDPCPSASP